MYPDEPYGKDLSHLFARDLERKAEILATIAYPAETKDFGPYIRKIIEIDLRSRRIPIPDDDAGRDLILKNISLMRKDRCDSRPNILPFDQSHMPDFHSCHIGQ